MAVMEFLKANIINTTTMMTGTTGDGTATVEYLFDRNLSVGYYTAGYNSTTVTILSIVFNETTPVSHIILQNHNLKEFKIYYNSNAANSLASFTVNSASTTYISFATAEVDSIDLYMVNSYNADTEKAVGELIITEEKLAFTRNPSVDFFNPIINRTQIKHLMPDGGVTLFNIKDKFKAMIGLKNITTSFYDSLLSIYEEANPLYYVPFPTSTAWDGKAYEVVWSGDFDFKYGSNAKDNYSGNILLEETISG